MEEPQKYSRLTVIETFRAKKNGHIRSYAKCICDCGSEVTASLYDLRHGRTTSCGCLNKERLGNLSRTHGLSDTKEWRTSSLIKDRCLNVNTLAYKWYGGRGVTICERWVHSFQNFLTDMGRAPTPQHSIDRIDNNGNYEPGNCRWATKKQQANNIRTNRVIEYKGRTKTVAQWCEELGLEYFTTIRRLNKCWPVEKVLSKSDYRKKMKYELETIKADVRGIVKAEEGPQP